MGALYMRLAQSKLRVHTPCITRVGLGSHPGFRGRWRAQSFVNVVGDVEVPALPMRCASSGGDVGPMRRRWGPSMGNPYFRCDRNQVGRGRVRTVLQDVYRQSSRRRECKATIFQKLIHELRVWTLLRCQTVYLVCRSHSQADRGPCLTLRLIVSRAW